MPSTYAHNAIGGETEKVDRTVDRREKTERTETKEKRGKTTDRQVKERARLEMFLTRLGLLILAQ